MSDAITMDWVENISRELEGGNDRATAIVAGATLDEKVLRLIRATLLEPTSSEDFLNSSGPVGTFSARIELARRLGLIAETTRKSLNLIRRIRNEAAHCQQFSFESNKSKDLVEKIREVLNETSVSIGGDTSKEVFSAAALILSALLEACTMGTKRLPDSAVLTATELLEFTDEIQRCIHVP